MSVPTLPLPRAFVTQLLNTLAPLQQQDASADSDPLSDAPETVKEQLLTMQVLFPNEFLPALDLLDRKLVTRFLVGVEKPAPATNDTGPVHHDAATSTSDVQMQNSEPTDTAIRVDKTVPLLPQASDTVHYVRSAQQRPSRFSTSYDTTISYQVRLGAWNCTCPAFAFAAFPSVHPQPAVRVFGDSNVDKGMRDRQLDQHAETERTETAEWLFGGSSLGQDMPPVCKHLLACVLAERCKDVFGQCVEERKVTVETAAGWAAGWGDT